MCCFYLPMRPVPTVTADEILKLTSTIDHPVPSTGEPQLRVNANHAPSSFSRDPHGVDRADAILPSSQPICVAELFEKAFDGHDLRSLRSQIIARTEANPL